MPLDETQRSLAMAQIVAGLLSRAGARRQDNETLAHEARELLRAIEEEAALPKAIVKEPRRRDSPHPRN
jgi:Zn-dependent M32 family carboxypeptidase